MVSPIEPTPSRQQRIRDEFERLRPMSMRAFARHCLTADIWTMEEREEFAVQRAMALCRKAIKAPERATPLPPPRLAAPAAAAGSISSAPRQLWLFEDYQRAINDLAAERDGLHDQAVALAEECRDRYGRAPAVDWPGGQARAAD